MPRGVGLDAALDVIMMRIHVDPDLIHKDGIGISYPQTAGDSLDVFTALSEARRRPSSRSTSSRRWRSTTRCRARGGSRLRSQVTASSVSRAPRAEAIAAAWYPKRTWPGPRTEVDGEEPGNARAVLRPRAHDTGAGLAADVDLNANAAARPVVLVGSPWEGKRAAWLARATRLAAVSRCEEKGCEAYEVVECGEDFVLIERYASETAFAAPSPRLTSRWRTSSWPWPTASWRRRAFWSRASRAPAAARTTPVSHHVVLEAEQKAWLDGVSFPRAAGCVGDIVRADRRRGHVRRHRVTWQVLMPRAASSADVTLVALAPTATVDRRPLVTPSTAARLRPRSAPGSNVR